MTVTDALASESAAIDGAPRPLGDPGARLLSGPVDTELPEALSGHVARLGALPAVDPEAALAEIGASGIGGRGGGGFPVARKLAGARSGGPPPLLVVNASESEPASRKDRTLCALRPHLVLDGAAVAAAVAGATEAVFYSHRGATAVALSVEEALEERAGAGLPDPAWRMALGPDRYVAGEASAAASFAEGGEAKPRFLRAPLAVSGVAGRPVVVHNAETLAHLALIARFGSEWWRQAGTAADPGSRLVTVEGAVDVPGLVLEVVEPATIGAVLGAAGVTGPPAAVLVGGYAGRWLPGDTAWMTPFTRSALSAAGASPGCGLLGVLPHGACPLRETARLTEYLAGQSAGQCGPCVYGLADVSDSVAALAAGRARRRDLRRLQGELAAVTGRGGCHHPDGVAALVASALDAFADDVARHVKGKPCAGARHPGVLPVPRAAGGRR